MSLTGKQEAFARAYTELGNASEAYRRSYQASKMKPETIWSRASELLADSKVAARVKEIQDSAAAKVVVTVHSLAQELEEARAVAMSEKQPSAAVSATMGKAKLFGLGSENRKVSGTIQVVTITAKQLDALTDDELALLETAYPVLQKLGLVGGDTGSTAEEGD
ncbi:MAG TPA: terminase small subunit [Alphaproteobacteria bacterium]|nr:terminase small subunit [Alphaproteobacteria bacterium]